MADMTALQRIIGGQARAHEALRKEDDAYRKRRSQYIDNVFLRAGFDPATVPPDQVDSRFQEALSVLTDPSAGEKEREARKREDFIDRAAWAVNRDPATIVDREAFLADYLANQRAEEAGKQALAEEAERQALIDRAAWASGVDPATIVDKEAFLADYLANQRADTAAEAERSAAEAERSALKSLLSTLSNVEGEPASTLRRDAVGKLTGIYQDPNDRPPRTPPAEALAPYINREVVEGALQSVGVPIEDIRDHFSPMYTDQRKRARVEKLLSDWYLSREGVAGEDWADQNMGMTLARQIINQMRPGYEPTWLSEFLGAEAWRPGPTQPLYNPATGGPAAASSIPTGVLSPYAADYEASSNTGASRPGSLDFLTQSKDKNVQDVSTVISQSTSNPGMQAVMLGIAEVESSMGKNLVNPSSGARGVFQITPETFRRVTSRRGSVLAPYKDYSDEEIKDLLAKSQNALSVSTVAAQELFRMNREDLPNPANVWAAIASHHLGIKEILKLYERHGLDINRDDPAKLVNALKTSKKSTHQEFVKWYPKVVENITSYRVQLEGARQ